MRNFQGIIFIYEHEHIGRLSNLHCCTFKILQRMKNLIVSPSTCQIVSEAASKGVL